MRQLLGFLLAVLAVVAFSVVALNYGHHRHAAEIITVIIAACLVVAVVLTMTGSQPVRQISAVFAIAVIATRCFADTASPVLTIIDAMVVHTLAIGIQAQTIFNPDVNEFWQCLRVLDSLWVGLVATGVLLVVAHYWRQPRPPRVGRQITVSLRHLFAMTAYAAFLALAFRQPQGWMIVAAQALAMVSIIAAAIYVSLAGTIRSPVGIWLTTVLTLLIFIPVNAYLPLAELLKSSASALLPNPNSIVLDALQELGHAMIPPLVGGMAVLFASIIDRERRSATQPLLESSAGTETAGA